MLKVVHRSVHNLYIQSIKGKLQFNTVGLEYTVWRICQEILAQLDSYQNVSCSKLYVHCPLIGPNKKSYFENTKIFMNKSPILSLSLSQNSLWHGLCTKVVVYISIMCSLCLCLCVFVRACVRVYVCAYMRVYVRACLCACVGACTRLILCVIGGSVTSCMPGG